MKRYLGISSYRYGGWRNAPNALTPEEVQAAMVAPARTSLDAHPREGKNEGRCCCFSCTPYDDGCDGPAEHTVVGTELTIDLCTRCFEDHRDAALKILEAQI